MIRGRFIDNVGRTPAPEWEELARAAWPGRIPLGLSAWFGRRNLTIFTLAMLVLLASGWLRLPWVAFGAWAIAGASEWLATRADAPTTHRLDTVGLRAPLRALLRSVLAAAVIFADAATNSSNAGLAYVTVIVAVQLAWVMQPVLATWAAATAPVLLFHPGGQRQPAATRRYQRIYARAVGAPVAFFLIELIALLDAVISEFQPAQGLASLLGLTVAGAMAETALIYLGWTAWQAYAARRDVAKMGRPVIDALTAAAPTFVVHLSAGRGVPAGAANSWLPAFDAAEESGMLVVRDARLLAELEAGKHPVVYAPLRRDLERVVLPSVRVACYVGHGDADDQLRSDPRLTHVLLAPLGSDKAGEVSNLAAGLDEVWVAGQAAVDRLIAAGVRIDPARVMQLGYPAQAELPSGPTGNATPIVLYAPTFEGYEGHPSYTSLDRNGARLVRRLVRDHPEVQVWLRPHPLSGHTRPSMATALTEIATVLRHAGKGHRVIGSELTLEQCLARADVLITDISTVASQFLATGRPILTMNLRGTSADEFAQTYPAQAASALIAPNLENLDEALADALGADHLRAARTQLGRYVLGEPPQGPLAAFAAHLSRVTAAADPAPRAPERDGPR